MPILDAQTLPPEITDKYEVTDNALTYIPKEDVKDKIEVEIGDSKQVDFKPKTSIKDIYKTIDKIKIRGK